VLGVNVVTLHKSMGDCALFLQKPAQLAGPPDPLLNTRVKGLTLVHSATTVERSARVAKERDYLSYIAEPVAAAIADARHAEKTAKRSIVFLSVRECKARGPGPGMPLIFLESPLARGC
jgi:hypothetical protein